MRGETSGAVPSVSAVIAGLITGACNWFYVHKEISNAMKDFHFSIIISVGYVTK